MRAEVDDWSRPDLDRWTEAVRRTIDRQPAGPWIAVGHSFGCLAVLQLLLHGGDASAHGSIVGALLVAPACPERHGCAQPLAARPAGVDLQVLSSSNDPWLPTDRALPWASRWGAGLHDLGDAGHVNPAAGFGPLPLAHEWVVRLRQRWHARRHAAEAASIARAA